MTDERRAPPRLVQTRGPAGDCLREALSQPNFLQPPRFALLKERRSRRLRRQRAALAVALMSAFFAVNALHKADPQPSIRAELARPVSAPVALASAAPHDSQAKVGSAPSNPVGKLEGPSAAQLKPSAQRASGQEPARVVEHHEPETKTDAASPADAEAPGSAGACAQLARSGSAQQALDCYAKLTQGSGMTAELSLFEQARLEGKVMRRPELALRTLDDYRRRFPHGSLRAEVMLAQIDWLLAAGDSVKALQTVDEALASGLLRERTAELERLRATLGAPAAN
ncbi:MAG: hypothetical protein ABUL60_03565 [Myxococcales bacterium]